MHGEAPEKPNTDAVRFIFLIGDMKYKKHHLKITKGKNENNSVRGRWAF